TVRFRTRLLLPSGSCGRLTARLGNRECYHYCLQMTREQIIGNIVIGLFLIVAGAVLHPLLKRAWKWINRRSPLTPQTKGQLVTNLAMYEDSLERLNYLSG